MVVDSIVGDIRPRDGFRPVVAHVVALAGVVPGDQLDVVWLGGEELGDALGEDGFADAVVEIVGEVFVLEGGPGWFLGGR